VPDIRGRALYYPLILIAGWVVGRAAILGNSHSEEPTRAPTALLAEGGAVIPALRTAGSIGAWPINRTAPARHSRMHRPLPTNPTSPTSARPIPLAMGSISPIFLPEQRTAGRHDAPQPLAFPPPISINGSPAPATGRRFNGYGYSFWRLRSARSGIAPAGQYGGSQSGVQAIYDLGGNVNEGMALQGRAAFAPRGKEAEVALGLRWQRPTRLPFSLTAERRIDPAGPDRWAAYAAGGFDPQPLPLDFTIDGYAQAGWVGGRDATAFFDAQSRLSRPLARIGSATLRAGIGAWAAGQDGAQRLDIGPSIAAEISAGTITFDLRLDWREKIAGSALPGSGPAFTIATGF
jgi:hypothetical protein